MQLLLQIKAPGRKILRFQHFYIGAASHSMRYKMPWIRIVRMLRVGCVFAGRDGEETADSQAKYGFSY